MSYADDTAVISMGKTWKEVEIKMNKYLEDVSIWLKLNKLTLNQFTSTPITESAIDDADDSTYETEDKGSKIMNISVSSLRIDLMLKTGLRMSRNKIETAFYEKRIQKNGFMIIKKSENVIIGDEIDLIANKPMVNPNFLTVSRITIADINFQHDEYKIKIVCEKNLIVENVSKNK
ncbi:uncharacterized protein LOC100499182 isoform X3 [Nasonia vitripennis]|uniref:Mitochondrial transcription rescue factor 1 C-terminal domain-containing protein n=2 Tax=Nasonia vitripennis TaxID=7425 RepID=A0A7M7QFQ9_NASVI|nr:uncharacterized protein LOC100499182 isoform X3 [Nasonia vitripennis]